MAKTNVVAQPGKQEIVITREFDAPRALVFKAYTDPELIPQWWGPRDLTTTVDKLEAKQGGLWRFVHSDKDGKEFAFHGVYHDLIAPEMLIYTFEWEGLPGHVLMETIKLEEENGKTKMTDTSVFQSVADRDGMLQMGMEDGASQSSDRLDELLVQLQKA